MLENVTDNPQNKQYDSQYVEDATLRSVILVGILYIVGLMAPYAKFTYESLIWYTPFVWVVLGFASITWICSYGFNRPTVMKDTLMQQDYFISAAGKHISAMQMVFVLLLLLYYLRENSTVYRVLIDKFPPNSIQYNSTAIWQRAISI
jgi:hypothetical protein